MMRFPVYAIGLLAAFCADISAEVQRIALFVGEDQGLDEERTLRYASRDAKEMAEAFRHAGTFDEDRLYLLVNQPLEKIKEALDEVKGRVRELRKAGTESLVLIYYSGHGSAQGLHIRGKVFSKDDLSRYLESLQSNLKIVILDACESGDLLRAKGGRLVEGAKVVKMDRLESQGTIMISSSSRGEMAQESEDYRGAVFTHHFLNGMRGLADYDGDKSIRLMEAFDYARVSTRREEILGQLAQQNPSFDFDVTGESDPVVARIGNQQSVLLLQGMPAGPLEIYDGNSMRLEWSIWLTGLDSLRFSLPSGKHVLAYRERSVNRVAEVDLTWQRMAVVSPGTFRSRPKSMLYGKGGSLLDMHCNGMQFSSRRAPLFADDPVRFNGAYLNEAAYVFRGLWTKQTLGLSYAWSHLGGGIAHYNLVYDSAQVVNRMRLLGIGYSLEAPLLRSAYGQILIGAQASYYRVFQSVRGKPFRATLADPGDGTVSVDEDSQANLYRMAVPIEGEIYLPHRFWISVSAGAAGYFYRYRSTGNARFPAAFEPAVSLGHQL
jgi:Caspase domain